jgi:thymidine phosphorylase
MEVTYALGVEMLLLAGTDQDGPAARARLERGVTSGQALSKFQEIVAAQGGDPRVIEDPELLPQADEVEIFRAERDGVVTWVEPRRIGHAIVELGGGRRTIEDTIDPGVGFVIPAKPGDAVREGEPLASIFARDRDGIRLGIQALREAILVGETGSLTPLITHRVTVAGVEQF